MVCFYMGGGQIQICGNISLFGGNVHKKKKFGVGGIKAIRNGGVQDFPAKGRTIGIQPTPESLLRLLPD